MEFVYITFPNQKAAEALGKKLVQQKLCACVNIIPKMTSIYRWKGKVEKGSEVILLAKTQKKLLKKLTSFVLKNHSYDVPCVLHWSAKSGNKDYSDWIQQETKT